MNLARVLRQDIAPVGSAYVLFLVVLVWYARTRRRASAKDARRFGSGTTRPPAWPSLIRSLGGNLTAAYLVFALIIAIFYLVLGGQPKDFIPESLLQGSVLAFGVVLPAFALLTWAERVLSRRRR